MRHVSPTRADYDELSSPDPLASDHMEDLPSHPSSRRRSAGTASSSKQHSSAAHHRKSNSIEISPSKTVTEQSLSPWRIRVTVEAEPEDADMAQVLGGKMQTVTKTMKIPLREENTNSPTKARKASPAPGRRGVGRRSVSPARKRHSVTDLDIVVLGDDAEEDEWGVKPKSPRRRRGSKSRTSKKSMPAAKKADSDAFEIREDEGVDCSAQVEETNTVEDGEGGSPELKQIDLNQVNMRMRSGSVKQGDVVEAEKRVDVRKVSMNSSMSYPTPSPTASERGHSDDHTPDDGMERREVGYDTVIESEGFTMIDLESLPSVKQMRSSPHDARETPVPQHEREVHQNTVYDEDTTETTVDAPSIKLSGAVTEDTEDSEPLLSSPPSGVSGGKPKTYSIGHLQLPSSTNVHRHRHVTPLPQSSPQLPSPPPPPRSVMARKPSPANSDKAMEAGMALRDAVTPEHSFSNEDESIMQARSREEDSVFGDFSSSTRRELRAELRFGEELGRRQNDKRQEVAEPPVAPANKMFTTAQPQIWRGETTVQHTPPALLAAQKQASGSSIETNALDGKNATELSNEARWEAHWREERDDVIRQAKEASGSKVIVIGSDHEDEGYDEGVDVGAGIDADETEGDIWLAEAKNASLSPRETPTKPQEEQEHDRGLPRRKLIPSPWKRGEQIEVDANATSLMTGDESMSGLLWKQDRDNSAARFGDGVLANPDQYDRRRSGIFDLDHQTTKQPRRLSPRHEPELEDNLEAGDGFHWRSAEEVVEEETLLLEAENELRGGREGTTNLYETNLDAIPEQDLSSSPRADSSQKQVEGKVAEHDSTYSSISEESSVEMYRQKVSLSPSKERPNTPRSAMKGGRASFAGALRFDINDDETGKRKVVWAKRSSCVNEHWEESSRSIRSHHDSSLDETPTPIAGEKVGKNGQIQAQKDDQLQESAVEELLDEPQHQGPAQPQAGNGWFGRLFNKSSDDEQQQDPTASKSDQQQATALTRPVSNFDGSLDSDTESNNDNDGAAYAPTSRHTLPSGAPTSTYHHLQPGSSACQSQPRDDVPSYLLPPSYPTIPSRDTSQPLSTSGTFTNTHFRTLHILYRKSQRSRFHGPSYPQEIRDEVRALVEENWKLVVDESESMDERFTFRIGVSHARVIERFMKEIEWDWERHWQIDGNSRRSREDITWGWTAEELAEKLGRIVIGEVVREEERAAKVKAEATK